MVGVWLWAVAPLAALHLWMWRRPRELLRLQLVLDLLLAAADGPALVTGSDLSPVRCLSTTPPFTEWQWDGATADQPTQSDLVRQIQPWMEETRRQLLAGRLPLVSERIGGGLPLLANGQTGAWAPCNLPVWALGAERGTTVMALWKLELAGCGQTSRVKLTDSGCAKRIKRSGRAGANHAIHPRNAHTGPCPTRS